MANTKTQVASGGGIGFCGLLTIAFIVLKLCHVIGWSWLWVLAPLWIGTAILLAVFLVSLAISLVVGLFALLVAWTIKRNL